MALLVALSSQSLLQALGVAMENPIHVIALYKPALMLCSMNDDSSRAARKHRAQRQTLADLQDLPQGLHSVGRLDRDSEGLLLLTNDGIFTQQVHSQCEKRYWALVKGEPRDSAITKMQQGGLMIRGAATKPPVSVQLLAASEKVLPPCPAGIKNRGLSTWLELVLVEGRNRQVRRITADAGHPTTRLVRVQVGSLNLEGLQPGEWKQVQKEHVLGSVENS